MDKLTIDQAFALREELKLNKKNQQLGKYTSGERQVLAGILSGSYDHYKEECKTIALEDIAFFDQEIK